MTSTDLFIVQLVARQDAIFGPLRDFHRTAHSATTNFAAARREFLGGGLQVRAGGRQNFTRQIERLQADGLIIVSRKRKSRFPFIRLTDQAEERARDLCALPGLAAGFATLERVAQLADQAEAGRKWIPEFLLCGWDAPRGAASGSPEMKEIVLVWDMAKPALCRGWIDSNATVSGHAAYCVTPKGRAALENDAPADFTKDLYDAQAWKTYLRAFDGYRHTLMTARPADPTDLGFLPLSNDVAIRWYATEEKSAC